MSRAMHDINKTQLQEGKEGQRAGFQKLSSTDYF